MSDISQHLAYLHTSTIFWVSVILTALRLALIRQSSPIARAVVDIVDAALFAGVVMFLIVLPFVVKSFWIPSGSMRPTLIDDDRILVNKLVYRFDMPHHDDVAVFVAPEAALNKAAEHPDPTGEPTDYIKRVIGLPGDVIDVHEGFIRIGPAGQEQIRTHREVRIQLGVQDDEH